MEGAGACAYRSAPRGLVTRTIKNRETVKDDDGRESYH